jgi:hypothetical protein
MYYAKGDSIKINGWFGATITNGKKQIAVTIHTPKSLSKISSITVTDATITVRQNGNYLVGDMSGPSSIDGTIRAYKTDNVYMYTISCDFNNALTDAINNDIASLYFKGTITFN